jgi:tetratricopeptide (TPR) repeat protein
LTSLRRAARAAAALACVAAAPVARAADPFAECAARFEEQPLVYESSYCFFQVAQQGKLWDDAARRLDGLIARHPENFWLTLARGNVEWTRDLGRAEAFYRAAALGFARQGQAEGEVLARYNLRTILFRKGRLPEAAEEVARVMRVAEASGESVVLARALTLQATQLTDTGGDVGEAYRSLRRAEQAAKPDHPYTLRRSILFALGNACFQLGRFEEALDYYRRVSQMASEAGDTITLATAEYSVVNTLMRELEELPRPGGRDEALALAGTALATAVAADNRETQVWLHRAMGELLGTRSPADAERHYDQCIAIARQIHQPRELAHCLWSLGRHLADTGRTALAQRRMEEALVLARESAELWSLAHGARQSMRVSWRTRPREDAIRESLEDLQTIEAVRRLPDDTGAEVFSAWARDYYWLAGSLLEHGSEPAPRADVVRAFDVEERMRARVLLDALTAVGRGKEPPAGEPAAHKRQEVLQRIVETRRELMDRGLAPALRAAAIERLEALELEEEDTRPRPARRLQAGPVDPPLARLDEVEAALAEDEALLSFMIGLQEELDGDFGGGAWLSVSTRHGTTVHRVPDRVRLQGIVPVFLGLFESRDGREHAAAASLYQELLAPALAGLPESVTRLVIVPDDALHQLPFAALRKAAGQEPLVARYEIAVTPSATLWLRWRRTATEPAARPALVLADPRAGRGGDGLAALPHAREEGRQVVRRLRNGSELWLAADASEHALKATPLSQFGILHFAAHAVVDDERKERSAVVLAPGSDSEDGLLQLREVIDLPLEGRVVVLSSCRSARGLILRGEGVVGFGRAFLQAGSHAVVGGLWPLRDDDAALLFDAFYRSIGEGRGVGAALRAAQREAIRDGRPAAAWAGLVVIGDGSLAPVPARSGGLQPVVGALLAAVLLPAIVLLLLLLVRRTRRSS